MKVGTLKRIFYKLYWELLTYLKFTIETAFVEALWWSSCLLVPVCKGLTWIFSTIPGVDMDIARCLVKIRTNPQNFQNSPNGYSAKLQSAVSQLIHFCLKKVHWFC